MKYLFVACDKGQYFETFYRVAVTTFPTRSKIIQVIV